MLEFNLVDKLFSLLTIAAECKSFFTIPKNELQFLLNFYEKDIIV